MPDMAYWFNIIRKEGLKTGLAGVKTKLDYKRLEHKSQLSEEEKQWFSAQRRAKWERYRASVPHFEYRLEGGSRIQLYLDSKVSEIIYCGDFEGKEQKFVNTFLHAGDNFVDVGANIGLFTLIAARRVGTAGCVYAFEPTGQTYSRLQTNIALNRFTNVQPQHMAVSSSAGKVELTVSLDGHDAWNSLAGPLEGGQFAVEEVQAVTWDEFAREHNLIGKVVLMKIDVEGWEAHVLAGAAQTLSRPDAPMLMVEFTDTNSRAAGSSSRELYMALEQLGYKMYLYDMDKREFVHDPLREEYPYDNLFAIKNIEMAAARMAATHR